MLNTFHQAKPFKTCALIFLFFVWYTSYAQPKKQIVEVLVHPTTENWEYKLGQQADFEVSVLHYGRPMSDIEIAYEIGPEKMDVEKQGTLILKNGTSVLKGVALDAPGFVRCDVKVEYEGKTYRGKGTAGIAPEKIVAVTKMPSDFDTFWNEAKEELKKVPMDPKLTLVPEQCTPDVNVYHVELNNIPETWMGPSKFYGMLSVPKKPGKYPAILNVPGAGARPYFYDYRAEQGVICFNVGIHGIPVNLDKEVYDNLMTGALNGYMFNQLNNKNGYFYKRVYMGCVRAVDFIYSMSEFDGENLAVHGGSQGGALSIITAGLDDRVKYLAAFYPALSDMAAYTEGRAGGWPHMFKYADMKDNPNWLENVSYYDVVNFARKLKIPGWYSWGFNDNVCPPTSMHAAYNSIEAPKELHIFHDSGHWTYPEQHSQADQWLYKKLKVIQ